MQKTLAAAKISKCKKPQGIIAYSLCFSCTNHEESLHISCVSLTQITRNHHKESLHISCVSPTPATRTHCIFLVFYINHKEFYTSQKESLHISCVSLTPITRNHCIFLVFLPRQPQGITAYSLCFSCTNHEESLHISCVSPTPITRNHCIFPVLF